MATLVLLVASAGCGNDNSDRAAGLTDARADTTVEGRVTVTGSSTVQPVSAVAAEAFRGQNDAVDISVEGPGTGDGLERFCEGGADIAGASRPIQPEELAACEAAGIEVIELPIGRDGITVIVSTENQVPCLSFVDLYALVGPESSGFDRWRDAGDLAFDLRSELRFPDDRLVVTGPGEESGTYDSFVEQVLDPVTTRRIAEGVTGLDPGTARADYAASADDNTIVEGVAAEPGGLGWVSFAYAEQAEGVREMPVARMPSEGCVAPTREAIQSGRYPIARALYLYVARGRADDPAVAAFVDFYLAGLDDFVAMSDYVPLADPEATVEVWEGRVVGSREGEPAEG
ncbi:MAG TPA: substrate-binding domain-containing protein [Acidimicrobiales bacterium]|nr:substrate-binding domain-containing protein [Acidimicrobiales bacterium]